MKSKKNQALQDVFKLTEEDICHICRDTTRDKDVICVVEDPDALAAIEDAGSGELITFFTARWRPWTE